MGDFSVALGNLPKAQRLAAIERVFGKLSIAGAAEIANRGSGDNGSVEVSGVPAWMQAYVGELLEGDPTLTAEKIADMTDQSVADVAVVMAALK